MENSASVPLLYAIGTFMCGRNEKNSKSLICGGTSTLMACHDFRLIQTKRSCQTESQIPAFRDPDTI